MIHCWPDQHATLDAAVPAGSKAIPAIWAGFEIGQHITIDIGTPIEESNVIVGHGSLILKYPLKYDHQAGATVSVASTTARGATTSLDAAGFKAVTSLCCPPEMETFFNRLLDSMGLKVCSKPHIQGLMHWFTCAPGMDFSYVVDTINNGNPCKYWAPTIATCPVLTPKCQGHWCR
jgi:hypothetical protein